MSKNQHSKIVKRNVGFQLEPRPLTLTISDYSAATFVCEMLRTNKMKAHSNTLA